MTRNTPKPARQPHLQGTYNGHFRGFGFFVPEQGGDDLFVPPGQEGDALDGDRVEVEPGPDGTARVRQVLARGRPRLVGVYLGKGRFAPDAHRIRKTLAVDGEARKGDKVLVATGPGAFRIGRVLGRAGAPEVEDAAVLAELDIDPVCPEPVLAEAERLPPPDAKSLAGRLDLRHTLTVVTIDPLTSRDFDDAVSVERQGDDWVLGVHIADVSHYVRPGTALDREAHRRGTSVYLPSRVIPMLPEKLSNDLCSLREGTDRLALSVLLRYDAAGRLHQTTFAASVIRPERRFSYERASRVMDGSRREPGPVGDTLRSMLALAKLLRRRRHSLEMPRSEAEFVYDAAGNVVDLHSTAADAAHEVIEEFMLAANCEVARLMLGRGVPTLYRHHPEPADLAHVWETLGLLGLAEPGRRDLARAVHQAAAAGYGPTVSSAVFRCMSKARYTTTAANHFNLAFDAYCHFTSPIRRYADLAVHRDLHRLLRQAGRPIVLGPEPAAAAAPKPDAELEALAEHLNQCSDAAERAESRIRRRRVLEFMLRQGAIPMTGQITSVVEKGLLVDLTENAVSGFLAVEILPGGPYQFEPGRLVSPRRTYRLGENIEVCVHRIDPASGQLDLAPASRR